MSLLQIRNLNVRFSHASHSFTAVEGFDLSIERGEILGIVGESGSGKSLAMLALTGLIDPQSQVTADRMCFDEHNLLTLSKVQHRKILGKDIAMVFQDPLSNLNPSLTIGYQIGEVIKTHTSLRGRALKERVIELIDLVEISAAKTRFDAYPHQLSGGVNQRVMIAMAIACEPKLLIADEPTTALDVTTQSQIMALLINLQKNQNMALIMITHDLALIAEMADRVMVMYAGQVVEARKAADIFMHPLHPYTAALLGSIPEHTLNSTRLQALKGMVPGQYDRPEGCLFSTRCAYVTAQCEQRRPQLNGSDAHQVRCFFPLSPNKKGKAV